MNELAYKIAPFIRGLSFDGNKGKIVTFSEESRNTPTSINLEALTEENYQDRLQKAFKEGTSSVTIESVGTFYLSETYDGAKALSEGKAVPKEEKVKADRNNIVNNKTALVTGGAQGFGEGMVRGLTEAGAFVYIADMNLEGAEKLAAGLNREQGRTCACAIAVNVTSEESVEAMMNQVALTTGGLDLFVSNAGVLKAGSVKEMTLKDFSFVTNVDYTGFFICSKYAARQMAIQNSPAQNYLTDIICISSKSGLEGSNKNGAYAGAKFGVIGLTQSFALELVADKIKVNALCPGNFLDGPLWSDPDRGLFVQYLNTGKVPGAKTLVDVRKFYEAKVPLNRGCTTEDVMKALFYTVDQKYETGQAIPITGGQLMLN
jgi:sorbitol-6-phosphate 2-dehydrogenase